MLEAIRDNPNITHKQLGKALDLKRTTIQTNIWYLKDNGFKCEVCSRQDKSCLQMSESTVNAIKYIIMSPAKKLFSFNLKDESLNELKMITKLYFNEKLEKNYKVWKASMPKLGI